MSAFYMVRKRYYMNKIGNLITKYRKENNLTQQQLADKLGVSNTAVSKWECGNNLPDITMLKPLSQVLNINVLTLIDLQEELVLENTNHSKLKSKILIIGCIVLTVLSIITTVVICMRTRRKLDEAPEEISVYTMYSDDERLIFDGYLIKSSNEIFAFYNRLEFNDRSVGLKNELKVLKVEIDIMIADKIIFNFIAESEDKKLKSINELLDDYFLLNNQSNLMMLKYSLSDNFQDEAKLRIKYYDKNENVNELNFNIDFTQFLNE